MIYRLFLSTWIIFISVLSPSVQAATPIKSYDKALTVAAIVCNVPYVVHILGNKNESLYNRLFYQGDHRSALWNHSLNLINFAALSSELPAKYLFLTGGTLVGLQTSTYVFCKSYGVSLVWSNLTGMLLHRLWIQKGFKWHLLIAVLVNSATLVYYTYNAPGITTVAHLGGVVGGFGLSFLLPYKQSVSTTSYAKGLT